MKVEYIEKGRFDFQTIWITDLKPEVSYHNMMAINVGQAIDLWKGLTLCLCEAGQTGLLDAGAKEFIKQKFVICNKEQVDAKS
jgi:hypothetical protein